MTLGIVAALHEEIADLLAEMAPGARVESIGMRDYHVGKLHGHDCVIVLARIGKVAAAATTTALIHRFDVDEIVFTGLAGGLAHGLSVGDVVIADTLVQHDMDASPLFPRYEIPLLGCATFGTAPALRDALVQAARDWLTDEMAAQVSSTWRDEWQTGTPRVHVGQIASGDRFVSSAQEVDRLRNALPEALAVEMEGAAVAQVCHEYGIPFAVMRTLSDAADDAAHVDFARFLREVASRYSHGILHRFLTAKAA
ncbi:5'-methylthioadenosine/adenosylhomocysteine nucleosidase [Pandoraea apista]|uniref:adenosylhomocysteine nucleosidase n=1 Tax=Pandoraea apista TaxID=93218 RepID=A0A0G4JHC3_9BURK|nr:5'-methylthioadenosine/adenosylhomocysteine nucleosidase [Pandoraea apista]ALS65569.1 5'-methylthioadenosine/S-adenosylhomocysteine nucleosidase [Pandoraea apista]OXS90181.1 5'-methylthioadenosine/S-adenosylhomocysteine nucleosidase [Pandoraea apista]PTD99215.1 5'-methylthioadenosine/adenosylhomocysteine nucleosidase [Pandoraea apista]RRJ30707.1 5'-methylthioadenosine/adenosylhomocysteine nucleosidase [Pandoraea apista]RRJ74161.1 5'-methylthioadenosine/adenosylhomocysteine nucleosidase [Pan